MLQGLTNTLTSWIDRWIPQRVLADRATALRARVLVGASFFSVTASLIVEPIRLMQEAQHWIALASWTVCTFLFILNPVVLRWTGRLSLGAAIVSIAMLVGSLGVAAQEGGVSSPNTMVMICGVVAATLLGGAATGALIAGLVVLCSLGLWMLHQVGAIADTSPIAASTLVTMRATMLATLSLAIYVLTLFYEGERNRTEAQLRAKALELEKANDAVVESARVKLELLALERDLQLTGAVQKLLLPKRDYLETEHACVAGFSVAAQQSGGDWWFTESLSDGRLRIVLGDVTGHGAAPAMVAAVVAGSFRTMRAIAQLEGDEVLRVLHELLLDVSIGTYTMPFGVVELSPSGSLTFYSAAAPPLLVTRAGGSVESITLAGSPLGSDELRIGTCKLELAPGERVLITSDGVPELRIANGRDLGLRRLVKMLAGTSGASLLAARDELADSLYNARGGTELHDDITFVLVERRASRDSWRADERGASRAHAPRGCGSAPS